MIITENTKIYGEDKSIYTVKEKIGSGGFGTVFKIQNENGDFYALKTLPQSYSTKDTYEGLLNEANNALKIEGLNILKYLYFHDEAEGDLPPYIIMEYATDGTLQDKIDAHLPLNEKINIMSQLIDGMEIINKTLVHRDLKPENILFIENTPKISDFGLSKIAQDSTRTRSFKGYGTPLYMSPECWNNYENTIQMDVYSLGLIFYKLLTEEDPFQYDPNDIKDIEEKHLFNNIKNPHEVNSEIPLNISRLILKMTHKNPKLRYQSWTEIRSELNKTSNQKISKYSPFVQQIAKTKITSDSIREQKILNAEKERIAEEFYQRSILFAFKNEILEEFHSFLEDLSSELEEPYSIEEISGYTYDIDIFKRGRIQIRIEIPRDEKFIRRVPSPFDRGEGINQVVRPKIQGEELIAWGIIKSSQGFGFNIYLCGEMENNNYHWKMSQSTNSAITRTGSHTKAPEPFGFDLEELLQEAHLFNAIHIYQTEVQAFNISIFSNLIETLLGKNN